MGRLDDIIARNKYPRRRDERLTVGIGLALFLLLVIGLMVFTDLGIPADDAPPPAPSVDPDDGRVHDVKLGAPAPRAGGR